jgi:probable F420-dependent oxidoreductase
MALEFAVVLPQFGPRAADPDVRKHVRDVAVMADRFGYSVVWTAEHLILPDPIATPYPYGGTFPLAVDDPILDVTATLAYVAAATQRVRLGSAVIVLPYHHPIALAKALATVDVLSNGRLLLGVASGWLREEFDMLGVPFRERGARTDEYLALIDALWTQERVTFRGRFFTLENAAFFPKPVQHPRPPIWIGGDGPAALRRVGRLGDGWLAVPRDLDSHAASITTIRREAEAAGRDPGAIGVATAGGARSLDELLGLLPKLEALGVTVVNVPTLFWTRSVPESLALMESFARQVGISR